MTRTVPAPLTDRDLDRLQALLEALPGAPDLSALDGFLVGVLLQPQAVPESRWLPFVFDFDDGAAPPAAAPVAPLRALVRRRHAELGAAIAGRQWFDPWVFEPLPTADDAPPSPSDAVLPWVAGWAAALERFPALLGRVGPDALEPLATLYAHFDPDDLEEVDDALLDRIAEVEPPATLADAVEDLVRCTLLLADAVAPASRR